MYHTFAKTNCKYVGEIEFVRIGFPATSVIVIWLVLNSLTQSGTKSWCRNSKEIISSFFAVLFTTILNSLTCSPLKIVSSTISQQIIRYFGVKTDNFASYVLVIESFIRKMLLEFKSSSSVKPRVNAIE